MRLFDILMQVGGSALLAWLAAALLRRKLYRVYPFFFSYVVFSFLAAVARFSVGGSQRNYFFVYWGTEALFVILTLLALHEAFRDVFRGFYYFWWFRLIFPGIVIIVALVSIHHGLANRHSGITRSVAVLLALGTAVNYVQAALFAVFVLLVLVLHTRWRRYPFDIVLGFIISALGEWVGYTFSVFGTKYRPLYRYAPPVAYICGTVVWLISFVRPLPPEPKLEWTHDVTPQQLLAEIQEQLKIIKGFVDRLKNDR